jgi:hypothetical protein
MKKSETLIVRIACWLGCMSLSGMCALAGVLGIDEPGTTEWSNAWYGSIADVLALDYDAFPSAISIDTLRGDARITFAQTAPYVRKMNLDTTTISDAVRWNYALGGIIASTPVDNLDQTLFLSQQVDHSFLIRASNADDEITRVDRLECLAGKPVLYSETVNCAFFGDSGSGNTVYRYCFESRLMQTHVCETIDTHISDMIFDPGEDVLYILSADYPGDIISVSCDDLQVLDAMTLPSNLRCCTSALDQSNNQIILVAEEQHTMAKHLVQIDLVQFAAGTVEAMLPDETDVVPAGVCGSYFMAAVSGTPSKLVRFNALDLTRMDAVNCSDEFGQVGCAALYENTIVLVDNSIPARVDIFTCDPFDFQETKSFEGVDEWLYCMAINPVHNQLMVSRKGSDPAVLVLVDLNTFSRSDEAEFSLNDSGWFALLASGGDGQFTYGYHTGTPEYLVRIRHDNYQADRIEPLTLSGQAVDMLVDDDDDKIFLIHGETLTRYNLETLEYEEEIVLDNPPGGGLNKVLLDSTRNLLVVSNGNGQVFKVTKSPLSVIDETILSGVSGTVTTGILLPDQDLGVYTMRNDIGFPAKVVTLNLESFTFQDSLELSAYEFEMKSISYCERQLIVHCGISEGYGGIQSFLVNPLELKNSNITNVMNKYVRNSIYDFNSAYSYWHNCHFAGYIAKTVNTNHSFITGSKFEMSNPANINQISFYSHMSAGSVRLAVYNQAMERLWESPEIVNDQQEDWIRVPIADGSPGVLHLYPGDYWLAFQVNGVERIASAHPGESGDGFRQPAGFGPFPDTLWYPESMSDRWAIYADWDHLYPTATPTGEPSASPTPVITATPTITPTAAAPSPTGTPAVSPTASPTTDPTHTPSPVPTTPVPTASPSPSVTPSPEPTDTPAGYSPGVQLLLNQTFFKPGDIFRLEARVTPMMGNPVPATLWVVLDVYGSYWFGPGWTRDQDWYDLGALEMPVIENILQFTWPLNCGSAYNITFWGALLHAGTWEIIGEYDRTEFAYHD